MKSKGFWGGFFKFFAMIFLVAPIVTLILINDEKWISTQENATKLSTGFIIALLFCLMMLKGAFKNLDKRLITAGTLLTFTVIVYLLDAIIQDLIWILLCAFIGYVVYLLFDTIGNKLVEQSKVYKHEKIRSQARTDYEEETIKGNV